MPNGCTSKRTGEITEAKVMAALVAAGYTVLVPWGDNQRYDLVIEQSEGLFTKIQCKTGRLIRGGVMFSSCSSDNKVNRGKRDYRGQVDLFGVYCRQTDSVYLVPVQEVGRDTVFLRIDPPKSNQVSGLRWAKDYILSS